MASATCAALTPLPTISTLRSGGTVGRRIRRNRLVVIKAPRVHKLNAHSSITKPCAGDDPNNIPGKSVAQATAQHEAAFSDKVVLCERYKSSSMAKTKKPKT